MNNPHPNDRIIFNWSPKGERQILEDPKGRKENANYLIVWMGKDWSGFMTFNELLERMADLEKERKPDELHLFDAVERI